MFGYHKQNTLCNARCASRVLIKRLSNECVEFEEDQWIQAACRCWPSADRYGWRSGANCRRSRIWLRPCVMTAGSSSPAPAVHGMTRRQGGKATLSRRWKRASGNWPRNTGSYDCLLPCCRQYQRTGAKIVPTTTMVENIVIDIKMLSNITAMARCTKCRARRRVQVVFLVSSQRMSSQWTTRV